MQSNETRDVAYYEISMWHHVRIHNKPTYFNIADVEEMGITTSKQAPKQTLTSKQNAL